MAVPNIIKAILFKLGQENLTLKAENATNVCLREAYRRAAAGILKWLETVHSQRSVFSNVNKNTLRTILSSKKEHTWKCSECKKVHHQVSRRA